MPKHGKKYRSARATLPEDRIVDDPLEAVRRVKENAYANFDETVELAVRLSVDPRHADQIVRGTVVLPHGTGKTVRVLAFAEGEQATEAEEAGADYVGMDYVDRIKDGWLEFDATVATPTVMSQIGQLGRILGPRGLMPSPKAGTVTMDVGQAVDELKSGKIEYRVDRTGNLHVPIGRRSFSEDELAENLGEFMRAVMEARPSAAKAPYVRNVAVSSTMGPGIRINSNLYRRAVA